MWMRVLDPDTLWHAPGSTQQNMNATWLITPQWIDEDYRAHLGYKAVLLAAGRDLKECPE